MFLCSVNWRRLLTLCFLALTIATMDVPQVLSQSDYPDGLLGENVRDKVDVALREAERLSAGPNAIGQTYTLKSEQVNPDQEGGGPVVLRAKLEDGSEYTFNYPSPAKEDLVGVSYLANTARPTGYGIGYRKGTVWKVAFRSEGKYDDIVVFHRSGKVAARYDICNEDGDIVRTLQWNEQGKMISDETLDEPAVIPFAASPEDAERVKAAILARDRRLQEDASKRPTPTPPSLSPVEEARQYARMAESNPEVVRSKFESLIEADPSNPENFFHRVAIVRSLIAPTGVAADPRPDEAAALIGQIIEEFPERHNHIAMLYLRTYRAIEIGGSRIKDYGGAADEFEFVLDFPQEEIVMTPPDYILFPLPPEEEAHLKAEHPARFAEIEARWRQQIHTLRRCAAGSYASLEYRRGGLPALEHLAAQRSDDPVFQEVVLQTLQKKRERLKKSIEHADELD